MAAISGQNNQEVVFQFDSDTDDVQLSLVNNEKKILNLLNQITQGRNLKIAGGVCLGLGVVVLTGAVAAATLGLVTAAILTPVIVVAAVTDVVGLFILIAGESVSIQLENQEIDKAIFFFIDQRKYKAVETLISFVSSDTYSYWLTHLFLLPFYAHSSSEEVNPNDLEWAKIALKKGLKMTDAVNNELLQNIHPTVSKLQKKSDIEEYLSLLNRYLPKEQMKEVAGEVLSGVLGGNETHLQVERAELALKYGASVYRDYEGKKCLFLGHYLGSNNFNDRVFSLILEATKKVDLNEDEDQGKDLLRSVANHGTEMSVGQRREIDAIATKLGVNVREFKVEMLRPHYN